MKRLLRLLIFASTFTIPIQSHAVLTSPCVLTDSQKAVIAELTRLHSWYPSIETAKACGVFSGAILVLYENGHRAMFSMGDAIVSKQEVPHLEKVQTEPVSTPALHMGSEKERKLFGELSEVWQSVESPDDLSQEELTRIDELIKQLFATTPIDKIELATYNMLGSRGNRYLEMIKGLPNLSLKAQATFYEGYFDHQASHMRQEDVPTDDQKKIAVQNLLRVFTTQRSDDAYLFSSIISEEIRRLDPAGYELIMQRGAVSEDISPSTKSPK